MFTRKILVHGKFFILECVFELLMQHHNFSLEDDNA